MARASFVGRLVVGEVQAGVKAYALDVEDEKELHILHRGCRSPIQYEYKCKLCGKLVPEEERTKGVLYKNRWIPIENDELRQALPSAATHVMAVCQFAPAEQINPFWIHKTYHLVPDAPEDVRPYAVISRACRLAKQVAVLTFVSHNKEHLAVALPVPDGLVLQTLHFASAIRSLEALDIEVDEVEPTPGELKLAKTLVESLSSNFVYANYQDTVVAKLAKIVEAKANKKRLPIPPPPAAAPTPRVISLQEALEKSIHLVKSKKRAAAR